MQNVINMYKDDLNKLLKDINALSSLYNNSINMKNNVTSMAEYRNITRAMESYMKNLVLSTNMSGDERLDNYKKVLQSVLKQDPTYVFESEILNLPKERLLGIMSEDVYNQFNNYKGNVKNYCVNVYNKIIKNESVSIEEKHTLMNFLYSNVGTKDQEIYKMQDDIMKNILNHSGGYDYHDANFFVAFIANEETKEYEYDVVTNVINFPDENKNARGLATKYIVNINADYAISSLNSKNKEDVANLLHTICHEVTHTKQNDDIIRGICNKETLDILTDKIFRSELSEKDFTYYHMNYYFEAGEKDAERTGFLHANKYTDRYIDDEKEKERLSNYLYDRKDHEVYVDTISMRRDSSGEKIDADKFRIEKMEEILKRNNSYLDRFPQFKRIYNSNGELKSFSDRLIAYTDFEKENKSDSNDIFLSSFTYSLDKGDLSNIDFSKMSKKDFFKTIHALSDLYNTYSSMAHNTLESVRQRDDFLTGERDIKNANYYRDQKVSVMASRYKKLESVLDVFYEKFGNEYSSIEEYSHDKFIYEKDKNYARDKFSKIKKEREKSSKEEIEAMLQEKDKQNVITVEEEISK